MKVRIFSKGQGWYISASNYKDHEDKAYMNVYFPMKNEPVFKPSGSDWTFTDIDIMEARFNAYKGKINMSVFKYEFVKEKDNGLTEVDQSEHYAHSQNLKIEESDLPFY